MKNSRTGSASRDHARTDDQHVHPGPQKAVEGFVRRANDGLVFIKRGVQYHRNSCDIFEFLDESPIERLGPPAYRLEATGPVRMGRPRDHCAFFGSDSIGHRHKRRRFVLLEVVVHGLFQNRWCKWTKGFSPFDASIQYLLHLRTARITDDAAIAQGSRPPFHVALESAN